MLLQHLSLGFFQLRGSLAAVLFLFSSWPFSILDVVQPVALQVQRPLITVVSLVVLGKEEFWQLCQGVRGVANFASALKAVGSAAWPGSLSSWDELLMFAVCFSAAFSGELELTKSTFF